FSSTALPTPDIYTLSLHDALPILCRSVGVSIEGQVPTCHFIEGHAERKQVGTFVERLPPDLLGRHIADRAQSNVLGSEILQRDRSEEHTSELQSRSDLVCRLMLEK